MVSSRFFMLAKSNNEDAPDTIGHYILNIVHTHESADPPSLNSKTKD